MRKRFKHHAMKAWTCGGDEERLRKQAGVWRAKVTVNECGEITLIDFFGATRVRQPKWKQAIARARGQRL